MIEQHASDYFSGLQEVMGIVPLEKLGEIAEKLMEAYDGGHAIFIMGNGGSGATASHFACDMNKGVSLGLTKRFKIVCLNDSIPTLLAYANDCSYEEVFIEQLKNFLKPKDVVIGLSSSGNSINVIKAIQYANSNSAISVALSGYDGGRIAKIAQVSLVIPANDTQKVEDMHLILLHVIMQALRGKLRK